MDDIDDLYSLFPEIKEHIFVEKKIGQGLDFSLDVSFILINKKI